MKKTLFCIATACSAVPAMSYADSPYFSFKDGDGFKRFSVSVGALYVKPTGKAQPIQINTSVAEGEKTKVGDVKMDSVLGAIDESKPNATTKKNLLKTAVDLDLLGLISYKEGDTKYLKSNVSGEATINGLSQWEAQGTGLEADDVATLGIMSNYFFTDNISLEVKAGLPPKVDIIGKGQIYAPLTGIASPTGVGAIIGDLPLKKDIAITDLSAQDKAASARAWTPAFEFQYHFGKTGVNKFRPYIGVGMMYAYFNELELNKTIEQDLINAGHMLINMKDNQAGAALDGKKSSGNPKVKLEADDAFAPVATVGFTYDFNDRWFAVGSVSYAQLKGKTQITISDEKYGELINAKTDIEINPILGYAGVGYRF
ncbi:OmpW/AlkL family protein [Acinetobacter sp. WCHAc060025]|uniref:OmpW/AlkL family protein n=1 Tax=Acinetobacter sp. WCHAc060025 TaxID=2518625 RepID=UPI001023356E|nr:OmpW family outer membrane protein [Acinetobacter sp. WCHAc060025]RZG76313.1 OmpW family protein [Acinetobacter sp. WCHAc060025]